MTSINTDTRRATSTTATNATATTKAHTAAAPADDEDVEDIGGFGAHVDRDVAVSGGDPARTSPVDSV